MNLTLITWDDPLVIPLNSAENVHFGAIYPFIDPNLAFYTLFEAQCPFSLSREEKNGMYKLCNFLTERKVQRGKLQSIQNYFRHLEF